MGRRRIEPNVKKEVIEMYQTGKYSKRTIGKKFGISQITVANWLKDAEIATISVKKYNLTPKQLEEMVQMYKDGAKYDDIKAAFGLKNKSLIGYILKSNGVALDRLNTKPKKEKKEIFQRVDTLCWECANALGNCSWSQSFTPVEGWTAKEIVRERKDDIKHSYCVVACPEFVRG